MVEGSEAWARFQGAMKKVLAVPHAEIQRRIAAHPQSSRAESEPVWAKTQALISLGLLLGILYQLVDGTSRDRVVTSLCSVVGPYGLRVLPYQT
jgi:hypothetical protein